MYHPLPDIACSHAGQEERIHLEAPPLDVACPLIVPVNNGRAGFPSLDIPYWSDHGSSYWVARYLPDIAAWSAFQ